MLDAKGHWLTTAGCSVMAALAVMATAPPRKPGAAVDTGHAELRRRVEDLAARVRVIAELSAGERRGEMAAIAEALDETVRTQNEWEERVLYPTIDARTACSGVALSALMQIEHARMAQSIDALAELALGSSPDALRFAVTFERLVGLLLGHLEVEDRVLFRLLEPG